MKKSELAEIKKMDIAALSERAKKAKSEIAGLLIEKNIGKMTNLRLLKNKRKDLAQVLTVKTQKQLLQELEKETGKKD